LNLFRPEPLIPNLVYPVTRRRYGFQQTRCNDLSYPTCMYSYFQSLQFLAFGLLYRRANYRTDTAAVGEFLGDNQSQPATM
jgi:hypothetical protein